MLFLFNKSSIIILFLCFSFSWKKQLLIYFWIRRLLFYVLCVFFFAVYSFSFPIVLFWFTFSVPYIHVYGEKAVSKTGRRESTSIQIHERDKEDIIISKEGKNEGGDGTIIIILKRRDGDVIFHLERVGKILDFLRRTRDPISQRRRGTHWLILLSFLPSLDDGILPPERKSKWVMYIIQFNSSF